MREKWRGRSRKRRPRHFHVSPLRQLQSAHSIWQFSATVLPPLAYGVMWSAWGLWGAVGTPRSAMAALSRTGPNSPEA